MPPCFSPASATAETASNDNTAAAHACTLRMLPSLDISASSRADFLERYHGGAPAQPARTRVILALRTKALHGATLRGGSRQRSIGAVSKGARTVHVSPAVTLQLQEHGP